MKQKKFCPIWHIISLMKIKTCDDMYVSDINISNKDFRNII